jgi:tRNA 2-thiouridine synthesizing protein D
MLFSGPYGSQDADHMVRIAEAALDQGYQVRIFLYGEGVHAQLANQSPKAFFNVGEGIERLKEKGADIVSCVRCSQARGYVDGEFEEGADRYPSDKASDAVRIFSLYGFMDIINDADRLITFGSG